MKVLAINNPIETKSLKEYGCVCPQCESVFIFDTMDIEVPRCINAKPIMYSIACPNPNCKNRISLVDNSIEKFKTNEDKVRFEEKYKDSDLIIDELGGIHEEGLGWNPNGVFCGECSLTNCDGCENVDKKE